MSHSTTQPAITATPLLLGLSPILFPLRALLQQFAQLLSDFRSHPVSPMAMQQLEEDLQRLCRELGRSALEQLLNSLEPDEHEQLPAEQHVGGTCYRRRNKSPKQVDSTFGRLELWRWLYEPRTAGERCLFPLEHLLGLVAGRATPALADRVGRLVAQHPQRAVLRILKEENAMHWSHAVLRHVAAEVAALVSEKRQEAQVRQVLDWLRIAQRQRGPHEPVLAAGRDGIMVPICQEGYQEAAIATLSVYDRRGRRMGTVYLGCMPEEKQETLTRQLTALLTAVLKGWRGRRPRLVYLTDGGHIPEAYYRDVLRKMVDPRQPGERLLWLRVLDYYHAAAYLSKMAEALFGKGWRAAAWSRRMRHVLKQAGGLTRVFQSASYHRNEACLGRKRQEAFSKAYHYLWKRRKHMDYDGYRKQGLPIGSGVTEAGCKVVATQRLKLSGMKWKEEGGQVVLTLRVVWLSGVWTSAWKSHLEETTSRNLDTYRQYREFDHGVAA